MHKARKRFGQNFLHDKEIIHRIISIVAPQVGQQLVEIGPGQGALTLPLLKLINYLNVVELDRDLVPLLIEHCQNHGTLIVHEADALQFDFGQLIRDDQPLRVIGNLPYNISTPLIFHLLTFAEHISDMHFMLQKEVVDRMAAKFDTADYGRLSIMVQYHCQVTALFNVPPTSFHPIPKVNSTVVRLVPHHPVPHPAQDYAHFANLVKQAFSQRRKTLRNSLKLIMTDNDWISSNLNSTLRAEQLTVADYVNLSNALIENRKES
jgi:16S rRNA (adenine1518-N6/adenine1519-N6)-dimethyltransferase